MDIAVLAASFVNDLFYWVIPFLFVLGVVVFVHEMGHFLVARWNGVAVEVFSIGFGPEIFGFYDRHGTRWRVSWIPLGGYVKFLGDENAASVPDREAIENVPEEQRAKMFQFKPLGQRAGVVAAGPFANFLLAVVLFWGLFMIYGKPVMEPRVDKVVPGSAAEQAGIKPGDLILKIDGNDIESFEEMVRIVGLSAGQPLQIVLERGGKRLTLTATPRLVEESNEFGSGKIGRLGIKGITKREDITIKRYDPLSALAKGLEETYFWAKQPILFVGQLIGGRASADQLGGPIRIAQLSKEVAELGIPELLRWMAIISVSIGLLNLFPIPVLDGGHLLFYGIEAILGRPLSPQAQDIGFRIGFALVIMLMIFVTWNDVIHLMK